MIKLTEEFDYLVCALDEWLEDRAERDDTLTDELKEWQEAPERESYPDITEWVRARFPDAKGIYGEGDPVKGCTVNEEHFTSNEHIWVYWECEAGKFCTVQPGYFNNAPADVWRSTDHEGISLLEWASGYANCDGECDTEWIIEDAGYSLWRNGGGSDTLRFHELAQDDDNRRLCPDCGGRMEFWAK